MNPNTDREAITRILTDLTESGHTIYEVADDTYNLLYRQPVYSVSEAVELVTAVDEAYVFLLTPNREDGWVRFVLGNDPEEVAADYTINLPVERTVNPWWE